jgi:hypothetical protein
MAGGAQGESRYCESLLHSFSLHLEMCESTVCQKLTHLLVQELSTKRDLNVYLENIMRCDYFGNVPDGHACSWMAYGALLVAGRSGLNYYYSLANWRLHD